MIYVTHDNKMFTNETDALIHQNNILKNKSIDETTVNIIRSRFPTVDYLIEQAMLNNPGPFNEGLIKRVVTETYETIRTQTVGE